MATLLKRSAPELAHSVDPEGARALLMRYVPRDDQQAETRTRMLAFLQEHGNAFSRKCLTGHFTGSALIVDANRERALLTLHRKLGRWLQLGGHCDGNANLPAVALQEAWEESGIEGLRVDPRPIDLDIHPIPERPGEPEHLHLDARFLVFAPEDAKTVISDESVDLRWFTPDEVATVETDDSVRRLFELAF